jgi:hypothetical protein
MRPRLLLLLPLVLAACAAAPMFDEAAVVVVVEGDAEGMGLLDASPSPLPRLTIAEWDDLLVAQWDEALARCDGVASDKLLAQTDAFVTSELRAPREHLRVLLERFLGRCYLRHAEEIDPPCAEAAERLCRWYGDDAPCLAR